MTHIRVVVPTHDIVRCEQHLGNVMVVRLESRRPLSDQQSLPHRSAGLNGG